MFFESPDPLVPQDTNGRQDVYEWEADGTGTCQRSAGCVFLLSSGQSAEPTFLADASTNGNDVFLFTTQQLVGQDQDHNVDIYDARVEGGLPSQNEVNPAPCSGDACRSAPSAPATFPEELASTTLTGAGNLAPPAAPAHGASPRLLAAVKVLRHSVHDMTITLKVKVPAKGGIVAYGAGLKTTKTSASGANTYTLHVKLSARAAASVRRERKYGLRHRRKLTVRVRFVPASGKASQVSVLAMVKA